MRNKIDPAAWPSYLRPTVEQMNLLMALGPNWGGDDTRPVARATCERALEWLLVQPAFPPTQMYQLADASLVLLWEGGGHGYVRATLDPEPSEEEETIKVEVACWLDENEPNPVPFSALFDWIGR